MAFSDACGRDSGVRRLIEQHIALPKRSRKVGGRYRGSVVTAGTPEVSDRAMAEATDPI